MRHAPLAFISLVVLALVPASSIAQDWSQPWADPQDRPPRVDISASAGFLMPTRWTDLVLLGSISPAPVSVVCLLLCPRGKMAGHDRCNQKSKECHPVLWIGNREFADRRQEVVVVSKRGCDGHEHGNREAPDSRNDQDG